MDVGLQFEELTLTTTNGAQIVCWYIPASTPTQLTILFCHGNGGDMGNCIDSISTFHNMGLNILIFDYQGYGKSSGHPTEANTYIDADAAWKYLINEKHLIPDDIIVFGRSLGGAIAAWIAEHHSPRCLVMESAFSSAPDMAAKMFPFLPARLICKFKYNNIARVRNIQCPILIAHSRSDTTIPFTHGQRLFEAANPPKQFVELHGDHNDGGMDIDTDCQKLFTEFIKQ